MTEQTKVTVWGQTEVANWLKTRVMGQVVPLLPKGQDEWPAFEVALRAAVLRDQTSGTGKLQEAIAQNPNAALLALVKCAQLRLSLNPAEQHYALVPYAGVVQGQVMYRGYQYLFQLSGMCEGMGADVVYKREHDQSVPLKDPITGRITHVPRAFERDEYPDEDIIGAYAWARVKGRSTVNSKVLGRSNIEKRRAMNRGAGPSWKAWYPQMCMAKAWQALFTSGELPLSPELMLLVRDDTQVEEMIQANQVPSRVMPVQVQVDVGQARTDPDWDAGQQAEFDSKVVDPLPSPEDALKAKRAAVMALANERKLSGAGLLTVIKAAIGKSVLPDGLETIEQCDEVMKRIRE
jgi:recombinational DNA repair protein RecT